MGSARSGHMTRLRGAPNFRDLGGHPTTDGGIVRPGLVFRSGALHRLTADDLATLAALRLRVVFDLRSDQERAARPSVLPEGIRCESIAIIGEASRTQELGRIIVDGRLAEAPDDFLEQVYADMIEVAATTFGRLFTMLAADDGLPAVIHCSIGKDRTGVACALLLSAIGVADTHILDDYELTSRYYTDREVARLQERLEASGVSAERYRSVFGAPRRAMAATLTAVREQHGSIERYLNETAGVDMHVLRSLRERLVER